MSNDEDSSAPEQSEVEASDHEEEEEDDENEEKAVTYVDGEEKKKVDNKSVTVQVHWILSTVDLNKGIFTLVLFYIKNTQYFFFEKRSNRFKLPMYQGYSNAYH